MSYVYNICFHIKYEDICFVSLNEDEPFCWINERVQTGYSTPRQDSGFSNVSTETHGMALNMGCKVSIPPTYKATKEAALKRIKQLPNDPMGQYPNTNSFCVRLERHEISIDPRQWLVPGN